jgi:exopolysaccharide biosynthesis protein
MPSRAFYVIADLRDRTLGFTTDTTRSRGLRPSEYQRRNPGSLVVVNGTFFNVNTYQNLDVVIREGRMVAYNVNRTPLKGKDTLLFRYTTRSAIGIARNRKADAAWLYSDSGARYPIAYQLSPPSWKGNGNEYTRSQFDAHSKAKGKKWRMRTAIGGGPMLVQNGAPCITNNEEAMFVGKAVHDRHPRTAMGYTGDGKLILLVVEGRNKWVAEGASLIHMADILVGLGCVEALNLDGGGSSCMLVNGMETIRPSDKEGQRKVPAVFVIRERE